MAAASSSGSVSASARQPLQVIVVGGSIAGLMYGLVLARAGHNVTVLERSTSYSSNSTQAAGISTSQHVLDYLNRYDRFAEDPLSVSCEGTQFLNPDGTRRSFQARPSNNVSWGGLWSRLRRNFDGEGHRAGDGQARYLKGVTVTGLQAQPDDKFKVEWRASASTETSESEKGNDEVGGAQESMVADFVIGADGATSIVKRTLLSGSQLDRFQGPESGYVAWRGTVPESNVSEETSKLFSGCFSLLVVPGGYTMVYHIPGENDDLLPGKRLLNVVWYQLQAPQELQELLTDRNGIKRHRSVPAGMLNPEIWERQRKFAAKVMPPSQLEVINKIEQPFVQVIDDNIAPSPIIGEAGRERVLLAGEALAVLRPHLAQGVNMIARGALLLADVTDGKMSLAEAAGTHYNELATSRWKSTAVGEYFIRGAFSAIYSLTGIFTEWIRGRYLWYSLPSQSKGLLNLEVKSRL